MVSNFTKEQIAIGLFIGVIVFTFFSFIRTIAEKFVLNEIEKLSPKSSYLIGLIFSLSFIVLLFLTGILLIIILVNQTDLHFFFDRFRIKK